MIALIVWIHCVTFISIRVRKIRADELADEERSSQEKSFAHTVRRKEEARKIPRESKIPDCP